MIKLTINGQAQDVDVADDTPLLWVLRDTLGLTGTKYGCGKALCGACTVHVDGAPTRSCITPAESVAGKSITTIEGLSSDRSHPVQQAWIELDVPQCGYCQSGQIMSAAALLAQNPKPSRCRHRQRDVRQHLSLRHVSAHSQGDSSCGRAAVARRAADMMRVPHDDKLTTCRVAVF